MFLFMNTRFVERKKNIERAYFSLKCIGQNFYDHIFLFQNKIAKKIFFVNAFFGKET